MPRETKKLTRQFKKISPWFCADHNLPLSMGKPLLANQRETMRESYFQAYKHLITSKLHRPFELTSIDEVFPALFLLRQYVELEVKDLQALAIKAKPIKPIIIKHDIQKMIESMHTVTSSFSDPQTAKNTIDKTLPIMDFFRSLDPKGDALRYASDFNGLQHRKNYEYMNIDIINDNALQFRDAVRELRYNIEQYYKPRMNTSRLDY